MGDARDAIELESTKHAGCWWWEKVGGWLAGKELEKSHSQGPLAEKMLYGSRIHMSKGKRSLLVSVNCSEAFGYRFPLSCCEQPKTQQPTWGNIPTPNTRQD